MKAKIQDHYKTGYNDLFRLDLVVILTKKELLDTLKKSEAGHININM